MADSPDNKIDLQVESQNNTSEHKDSNSLKELRDNYNSQKKEIKALRQDIALANSKAMFGKDFEEGAKMLEAGLSEDRIKELLKGSTDPDPLVKVDDDKLEITKQDDKQPPKKELSEEEKQMEEERISHERDLEEIKKFNRKE